MLKKETYDILKQSLIFAVFILALPAFLVFTHIIAGQSYTGVFYPVFQFGLLFWAFFMGVSLFSAEHSQRGVEYMLSLPYSRLKLTGMKVLPRFTAVLLFYLLFTLLYSAGDKDLIAFPILAFTIVYFLIYLVSLSLSNISRNFLVLFVSVFFALFILFWLLSMLYLLASKTKDIPMEEVMNEIQRFFEFEWITYLNAFAVFAIIALLLPLVFAFIASIKKYDLRPVKVHNKRYFKFLIPVLILCIPLSFLFAQKSINIGYSSYYLTEDLKLIESNYYRGIRVYYGDEVHKVKTESCHPFFGVLTFEDNDYIYDLSDNKLSRIKKSDFTIEIPYEAPKGKHLYGRIWQYKAKLIFLERKYIYTKKRKLKFMKQLVLFDRVSGETTKISLEAEPLKSYYSHSLIGACEMQDRLFLLLYASRPEEPLGVFRIWKNGEIEKIAESLQGPSYVNQMLLTYSEEEIIFSRERDGRFEAFQRIPNPGDYHFRYEYHYRACPLNARIRELMGWRKRMQNEDAGRRVLATLDLEKFEIKDIGISRAWPVCFCKDVCYIYEIDRKSSTWKIYSHLNGQVKLIKTFQNFNTKGRGNRSFISRSGLVLRRKNKVKVYVFPDLREIKFKKL